MNKSLGEKEEDCLREKSHAWLCYYAVEESYFLEYCALISSC